MPGSKITIFKNIIFVIFIIIFVLFVLVMTFRRAATRFAGNFFYPFLNMPVSVESSISDKSLLLESKFKLTSELERLRRENDLMSVHLATMKKLEEENLQLRNLVRLAKRCSFNYVFAEIILRDPTRWKECFTINKGSADGITIGSVVLSYSATGKGGKPGLAVAGRITSTTRHTAVINTIMSKECRLSAFLPRSKATGIINGGVVYKRQLYAKLTYLPLNKKYDFGEAVFTSGLSSWTPSSLYIGQLIFKPAHADKSEEELYCEGIVDPALDFENLRFIMVVQRTQKE